MVKTPQFHYRGHGFNPWSGNQDLTCHVAWPKKKEKKKRKSHILVDAVRRRRKVGAIKQNLWIFMNEESQSHSGKDFFSKQNQ